MNFDDSNPKGALRSIATSLPTHIGQCWVPQFLFSWKSTTLFSKNYFIVSLLFVLFSIFPSSFIFTLMIVSSVLLQLKKLFVSSNNLYSLLQDYWCDIYVKVPSPTLNLPMSFRKQKRSISEHTEWVQSMERLNYRGNDLQEFHKFWSQWHSKTSSFSIHLQNSMTFKFSNFCYLKMISFYHLIFDYSNT